MVESNQELLEKTKFEVKQHESKLEELQSVIFFNFFNEIYFFS